MPAEIYWNKNYPEFRKDDIVTFEGRPLHSSRIAEPAARAPVPGELGVVENVAGTAVWIFFPYIPARYCMFPQMLKLMGNPEQQIVAERMAEAAEQHWPKGLPRKIAL